MKKEENSPQNESFSIIINFNEELAKSDPEKCVLMAILDYAGRSYHDENCLDKIPDKILMSISDVLISILSNVLEPEIAKRIEKVQITEEISDLIKSVGLKETE